MIKSIVTTSTATVRIHFEYQHDGSVLVEKEERRFGTTSDNSTSIVSEIGSVDPYHLLAVAEDAVKQHERRLYMSK